ncbi:MAG: glycoside hydrolase family 65 protein, partial [Gaiellales bacterium]
MIHREPHLLPLDAYPLDDWSIIETEIRPELLGRLETMFATANGYLGVRGAFEEGRPVASNGTYVNGFYESWPIVHGEYAYGFATMGQTIVNVTDGKLIKLFVDDEPLELERANLRSYVRRLDMRAGALERDLVWETMAGKHVRVTSRRIVSFAERHLCAISYRVELLDAAASVVIVSQLVVPPPPDETAYQKDGKPDPRKAPKLPGKVLMALDDFAEGSRLGLTHRTENSGLSLACVAENILDTECAVETSSRSTGEFAQVAFDVDAAAGTPIQLSKFVAYHHSDNESAEELVARAGWTLDRAERRGFDGVVADHEARVADLWRRADVELDPAPDLDAELGSRLQQTMRFNIFHLLQASARVEGAGIAAKGLTSDGYEGHYFWDTEIYVMPFLTYTSPQAARSLLELRYRMLGHARERALAVNAPGAKFPWRTINGEEASAFYAAGTAQYHINADIAYALRKYVAATGDTDFLAERGAEMLVETARL